METTLGDLIVALTEETHHFLDDERETYELVAYLLSERLTPRSSQPLVYRTGPQARVPMGEGDSPRV
ncbi:MAG: hypothetical protein ACREQ7_07215 [Candidatus Binatia bacterium]